MIGAEQEARELEREVEHLTIALSRLRRRVIRLRMRVREFETAQRDVDLPEPGREVG